MFKLIKWGVIGGVVLVLGGGFFFGRDLLSYATSSGKILRTSVKETIPVQFEIQRARDLLEDLIPEMHANLRLVAQEEVEVASLEKEIVKERDGVGQERGRVQKMRQDISTRPISTGSGEAEEAVDILSQRFERFRTAEMLLSGKEKLLSNRRKSLQAAIHRLEKTRLARVELAAQIEALEGQFRLVQAQGTSSDLRMNETKLAQTQRLLTDLRKRLEVAQRVLEREAQFTDPIQVPKVTAENLVEAIDSHFARPQRVAGVATGSSTAAAAPSGFSLTESAR